MYWIISILSNHYCPQNVIYQAGQKRSQKMTFKRVKAERIPLQMRRKDPFLQQFIVILIYKSPETFHCIVINSFRISEIWTIVLVLSSKWPFDQQYFVWLMGPWSLLPGQKKPNLNMLLGKGLHVQFIICLSDWLERQIIRHSSICYNSKTYKWITSKLD